MQAGDDVSVTGNVCRRWRRIARGARCDLEVLIKANNIKVEKGYQRETVSSSGVRLSTKCTLLQVILGLIDAA